MITPRRAPTLVVLISLALVAGCARAPEIAAPPELAEPAEPEAAAPESEAPPAECAWLGIVVDNHVAARPQAGISLASVVYEFPTEGTITRLLAFFCDGAPEVVGPVRSLRAFMLEIARDFDAPVAHSGGSTSALAAVRAGAGPVINEFWQSRPFWRDGGRRKPHNLYASVPALRSSVSQPVVGPPAPWDLADDTSGTETVTIDIPYGDGYDVRFVYDPTLNRYVRHVAGQPAVDAPTGAPITAGAVIVQYVRWRQIYEGPILTGHIQLTDEGRMVAFTGGLQIEGRWRRASAGGPTVYTDAEGGPLRLAAGAVWINLVPLSRSIRVSP